MKNNTHSITQRSLWARSVLISVAVLLSHTSFAGIGNADSDSFSDNADNCIAVANDDQRDTDGDGIGNICDADLDQNCIVNFVDISLFASRFLTDDPDADLDGSGSVNFVDYVTFANSFLEQPGPSGASNICTRALTLIGLLRGVNIPATSVNFDVVVDGTQTGGGLISFGAIPSVEADYIVGIEAPSPSDFVTVRAFGTGAFDFVRLKSLAGTEEALYTTSASDGVVGVLNVTSDENADSINVSNLSTAFAVLAEEANGGPIYTDEQLERAAQLVRASDLVKLAALLKVVIDNPDISLPTGVANTLALIEDLDTRNHFGSFLAANHQAQFDAALVATAAELQVPYVTEELEGDLYLTPVGEKEPFAIPAYVINFLTFNEVVIGGFTGSASATWSIDSAGSLVVDYDVPHLVSESFRNIEDPNNPGTFVDALLQTFHTRVTVLRFRQTDVVDHVFVLVDGFSNFPDYPSIPDELVSTSPNLTNAQVAVDDRISEAFDGADLIANSIVVAFSNTNNDSVGYASTTLGFDTLDFNADGTGQTRRRGLVFDWMVTATGELELAFANGDTSTVRLLYEQQADVHNAIITNQVAGSSDRINRSLIIERNETVTFNATNAQNKRFRAAFAFTPGLARPDVFDFVLSDEGVACRNPDSAISTWMWEIVDGRIEIFREITPEFFFFRTWEPILVIDNQFWVIETLQVSLDGLPPIDPAVTPGRFNIYQMEQDLVNNARTTLINDSYTTSVNTPIHIMAYDFLGNESDPENDQVFWYGNDSATAFGGVIQTSFLENSAPVSLFYTPPPGFVGTDEFTYTASDLACRDPNPDTAVIQITVTP